MCVCISIEHLHPNRYAHNFIPLVSAFIAFQASHGAMAERHMFGGRCVLACNLSSSADCHASADEVLIYPNPNPMPRC